MSHEPVLPSTSLTRRVSLPGGLSLRVSRQRELAVGGQLASARVERLWGMLRQAGVEVLASSPRGGAAGPWMLVVKQVETARALLQAQGLGCREEGVLLVEGPCQIGWMARFGQYLSQHGIGICHSYLSAPFGGQLLAVCKSTDDEAVWRLLLEDRWSGPEPSRCRPVAVSWTHNQASA